MARYSIGESILSLDEQEWAYEKWCAGYTQTEIAKALFVSHTTIGRVLAGRKKEKAPLVYEGRK